MLDISRVTSLVRVKRCGVSSQPRPLPFAATDSLKNFKVRLIRIYSTYIFSILMPIYAYSVEIYGDF